MENLRIGVGVAERVWRSFLTVMGKSEIESDDDSSSWIDCLPEGLVTDMNGTFDDSGEIVSTLVSETVCGDGISSTDKSSAGLSTSSSEASSIGFFMGMTFFEGIGLMKIVGGLGWSELIGNNVPLLRGNSEPLMPVVIGFDGLNSGAKTLNRLFDDCCK